MKLDSEFAINPMMKSLLPLWDEKKLTFVLGVGWPNSNRSHFMAMEQWSTGNESGTGKGWLAVLSDSIKSKKYLLSLGATGSNSVEGAKANTLHLVGKEKYLGYYSGLKNKEILRNREVLKRFLEIDQFSTNEIIEIRNKIRKLPPNIKPPKGKLSSQISTALQILNTESPPSFIQMEMSGFDTHQNQIYRQNTIINQIISENNINLSGGEKQKIAICRAFFKNSKFIFLDETFSNLDRDTTKKVKNYIKNLRNKGIVIVSHNLEDLDVCNRNLQIENGKIFEL